MSSCCGNKKPFEPELAESPSAVCQNFGTVLAVYVGADDPQVETKNGEYGDLKTGDMICISPKDAENDLFEVAQNEG